MILLLGHKGYVGSAFVTALNVLELPWKTASHEMWKFALSSDVELLINCAAFIPPQSVSLCDEHPEETIWGNTVFPIVLAQECEKRGVTFAHISTGCLWSDGKEHTEDEHPQRAFTGHCGFYVGTKVLAERGVRGTCKSHYIWRVRLPFDQYAGPRNYLSKIAAFPEVWDHENTISHRGDFAHACLELWMRDVPFGTYNVMNPGSIRATRILDLLRAKGIRKSMPKISTGGQGGSIVSVKKMLDTGVTMRPVEEAVQDSINHWLPEDVPW